MDTPASVQMTMQPTARDAAGRRDAKPTLGGGEIGCSSPAALGYELVADTLAFREGRHSRSIQCSLVNENVAISAIGLNESITFGRIEEFYCSGCHHGLLK